MSLASSTHSTRLRAMLLAAGLLGYATSSLAFFDSMNPGRWFGGDDDYDDYYDRPGPYGGPGFGPGYGPGGYPPGAPGPYGTPFGGPGYFGAPGPYGAPGAVPGPQTAPSPSGPTTTDQAREIEELKRRIEELESSRQQPQMPPRQAPSDWPTSPGFRPMDRY